MRVISKKPLRDFWEKHTGARAALQAWYEDALRSEWRTPSQIKASYANASILGGNRVVFNIKGNAYRLVVKIHYDRGTVYIRFVGTHREYDGIDAETI
ncbi:MAG: type II toxin-antitoxin system HigB family toxin [Anaerolineae bacterium]|jgi:mRNA interferase HigB|nr:type II toxin-antitoxin system HigB family toxin [Anaerolineae bacterium]